jgi:hypothetical protein
VIAFSNHGIFPRVFEDKDRLYDTVFRNIIFERLPFFAVAPGMFASNFTACATQMGNRIDFDIPGFDSGDIPRTALSTFKSFNIHF